MASPLSTDTLWIILIVGAGCLLLMPSQNPQPCYCEKCEHKLLQQAQNGDVQAQKKLQQAIAVEEGQYHMDSANDPFAFLFRLILIGLVVYVLYMMYQSLSKKGDDVSPLIPQMSPVRRSSMLNTQSSLPSPSLPTPSLRRLSQSSLPSPSLPSARRSSVVPQTYSSVRRPSSLSAQNTM